MAQAVSLPGVDFGVVAQQELDDVDVATGSGETEWRVVGHVAVLLVGATLQQHLNHLHKQQPISSQHTTTASPVPSCVSRPQYLIQMYETVNTHSNIGQI